MTRRNALKLGTGAAVGAKLSLVFPPNMGNQSRALSAESESTGMSPASENEICFMRARDLATMIREKKMSSREVMQAHLKQIARVNPKVNAIVTLVRRPAHGASFGGR